MPGVHALLRERLQDVSQSSKAVKVAGRTVQVLTPQVEVGLGPRCHPPIIPYYELLRPICRHFTWIHSPCTRWSSLTSSVCL